MTVAARRPRPTALLAALGCVAALAAAGCGQEGKYKGDDPRSAVNQLLLAAVGQANGQRACSLLTTAARARLDATAAGSCRQAMSNAISSMPGAYSSTDDAGRAAEDLEFTVKTDGDRSVVTAWRGSGRHLTFRLVRLTKEQEAADTAGTDQAVGSTGHSRWRVDTGAEQLLHVGGAPERTATSRTTG